MMICVALCWEKNTSKVKGFLAVDIEGLYNSGKASMKLTLLAKEGWNIYWEMTENLGFGMRFG
jgi:hypothetical protein